MKRIRETSRISYHQIPHTNRKLAILRVLRDSDAMTARECSKALGSGERNYTQPRLTALVDDGMVEVLPGRVLDKVTQRLVSAYRITDCGRRWLNILEGGCNGDTVDTGLQQPDNAS